MRMSLNFAPRMELALKQRLQLSLDYRIYEHVKCPNCRKKVNPRKGWSDDPRNCTVTCTHCGHKFEGQLRVVPQVTQERPVVHHGLFRYLCASQTLYELQKIAQSRAGKIGEKFLHNKHPDIFFSSIKHFGTYAKARRQVH